MELQKRYLAEKDDPAPFESLDTQPGRRLVRMNFLT
jgi:hypothetical protein